MDSKATLLFLVLLAFAFGAGAIAVASNSIFKTASKIIEFYFYEKRRFIKEMEGEA